MKKVLSLALAVMLVLGMSSVAFAAFGSNVSSMSGNAIAIDIDAGLTGDTSITLSGGGTGVTAGNYAGTFSGTGILTSAALETYVGSDSADLDVGIKATTAVGTYTEIITFTDAAPNTATVRVTITVTDSGSGGTTTSVPNYVKIIGIDPHWTDYLKVNSWDGPDFSVYDKYTEDTTAKYTLLAGMFEWEWTAAGGGEAKGHKAFGRAMTWDEAEVRSSHLKDVNVRKTNPVNNSGTLRDVSIDNNKLKIRTVTYFLKCGETDVAFDLDLTYKSKASTDLYNCNFTIHNAKELMYDGQDYADTTDHIYVQADVSLRNVEMFVGENLYITKSFGKDQKAYAHVTLELSAGDEALFQKFAELSDVYTLYTVNVSSANVTAEFKDLGDTYFVYDENYKLVGTTADKKLPFSNKYYLTTKKVDLAGTDAAELPADEDSSTAPTGDTGNAGTGGGTVSAPSNYNPNTGC